MVQFIHLFIVGGKWDRATEKVALDFCWKNNRCGGHPSIMTNHMEISSEPTSYFLPGGLKRWRLSFFPPGGMKK